MSQRHNDNIKKPKPQDVQLGILKIYIFYEKTQQRALGPADSIAGVIQLNCEEVHTHASYKTTKTWENFNKQGIKIILLSDKHD